MIPPKDSEHLIPPRTPRKKVPDRTLRTIIAIIKELENLELGKEEHANLLAELITYIDIGEEIPTEKTPNIAKIIASIEKPDITPDSPDDEMGYPYPPITPRRLDFEGDTTTESSSSTEIPDDFELLTAGQLSYKFPETETIEVAIANQVIKVVVGGIDVKFKSQEHDYKIEEMRLFKEEMAERIRNEDIKVFIEEGCAALLEIEKSFTGDALYKDRPYPIIIVSKIKPVHSEPWKIDKIDLCKGFFYDFGKGSGAVTIAIVENLLRKDPISFNSSKLSDVLRLRAFQAVRAVIHTKGEIGDLSGIEDFETFKKDLKELNPDHFIETYKGFAGLARGDKARKNYANNSGVAKKVEVEQFNIRKVGQCYSTSFSNLHFIDSKKGTAEKIFSGGVISTASGEKICDSDNLSFTNCVFIDVDFTNLSAPKKKDGTNKTEDERNADTLAILRTFKFIGCEFKGQCKFPEEYARRENIFLLREQFDKSVFPPESFLGTILKRPDPAPKPATPATTKITTRAELDLD